MESRFGADFSGVRVHTGGEAAALNREVSAQAFTHGRDIFVGEGKYSPTSSDGQRLLAHELTHVIQQNGAEALPQTKPIQRQEGEEEQTRPKAPGQIDREEFEKSKLIQRNPDDPIPSGPAWDPKKDFTKTWIVEKPAPKRSNSDASTTSASDPTFTGGVAVDAKKRQWRYQLASMEAKGKIQIVYYTVDHYPAPVPEDDSGDLSNVTQNNWKDIVKDLDKNKRGIADQWSAYRAEDVHENYHWEKEWQVLVRKALKKAQKAIAKLGVGFDKTSAEADAALKPQATTAFDNEMKEARKKWNKMGDSPGDPPYRVQVPVIEALIKRVKDHAKSKGWK
jgi:hypothetical protein